MTPKVLWGRIKARLLFLLIGLVMGLILAGTISHQYKERIEQVEAIRAEQIAKLEKSKKELQVRYSRLESEHKKATAHVHIVERTNPDGSTEKIYDSKKSMESERKVEEHQLTIQKMEYEHKLDALQWREEKRRIMETQPSASLSLGVDNNLTKYLFVDYNILSTVKFGIFGSDKGEYGIALGVTL